MRLDARKKCIRALVLMALFSAFVDARAVTFTSVTAIGDSLSDGGNEPTAVISAYKLFGVPSGYVPTPGYYNYKYCDGYTAVEYFSYYMGMYDVAHFFNYAVAGITTNNLAQVLQKIYMQTSSPDPTGLYVFFIGGNDIFQSSISRDQTAENIKNAVADLYSHGARYFMVLNLPKMSDSPNYNTQTTGVIESVDIADQAVNTALATKLSALPFSANVVQADAAYFSQLITQDARSVGFTDLTDACVTNATPCATPQTYVYWDDVHYSNSTNSYLGAWMKAVLDSAGLK